MFARETAGAWSDPADLDGPRAAVAAALDGLDAAVEALTQIDLDALDDEGVRELLRGTQRHIDRLSATRATATAALKNRLVAAAGPGREQRGIQDARHFLTNDLRLTPSEAKRTERTGTSLTAAPRTRDAFCAGDVGQEHAKVITDTLRHLTGETRDQLERQLLDAAHNQDPVALGRTARRLLAEADYDAAVEDDKRRHARRRAAMTQLPDGGVALHAMLYGIAAERAWTAWHAFHTRDTDERRSSEQRAADALEQIFDVALRSGQAATNHGVRPHVEVVIGYSELAELAGIAELAFTGPITIDQIRPLLGDASVTRVIMGPDSVPIEIGKKTRYISPALWTALKLRDKGCVWPGCTAPPGWCQVAHGNTPYRDDGLLTLANSALLCIRHHRIFDNGNWIMHIDGATVTFHPP